MARKKSIPNIILKKFPEYTCLIEELYTTSDSFQSLCQDYTDCLGVIKRIECSSQMNKKGYKKEYEILLQELENELIKKLTG